MSAANVRSFRQGRATEVLIAAFIRDLAPEQTRA
jgi:hypothetical protein